MLILSFVKKYWKIIASVFFILIVLYFSSKILNHYFDKEQSEKQAIKQLIISQTQQIQKQNQINLQQLQEISILQNQLGVLVNQNKLIKDKLVKFEKENPTQNIPVKENPTNVVNNINAWYNSGNESKAYIEGARLSVGQNQTQQLYYDAANWHINGPILKTELDYSKQLNSGYENQINQLNTINGKQSQLIDSQQKSLDLQESRFQNSQEVVKLDDKQISNLQKEVKIQKIEKYGAYLALALKLLKVF